MDYTSLSSAEASGGLQSREKRKRAGDDGKKNPSILSKSAGFVSLTRKALLVYISDGILFL